MLEFLKTHSTKILIVLLLFALANSCSRGKKIKKLEKDKLAFVSECQSKDSLLNVQAQTITRFPEQLRQNSLLIHQEYDLWITKRDRGPQLMELHNDFVKPKIQSLSK